MFGLFARSVVVFITVTNAVFGVSALTAFTWRGNILKLKDVVQVSGEVAPFKLEVVDVSIDSSDAGGIVSEVGTRGYPMLPEAKPAFPGHRQLVFSNEMKFRELMMDCQKAYSNELIRCYVDETGTIDRVGLLCRIIESRSLKNGQAMYIIESEKKIRIDSMTVKAGKSYLSSTSTHDVIEETITEKELEANEELAIKVFNELKKYLRLTKLRYHYESNERKLSQIDTDLSFICLSPDLIASRPKQLDFATNTFTENVERHTKFSNTLGNLLSSSPTLSQFLLTSPTADRLKFLASALKTAFVDMRTEVFESSQKSVNGQESLDVIQQILELDTAEYEDKHDDIAPPSNWENLNIKNIEFDGDDEEGFQPANDTDEDDDVMQ